MWSDCLFWGGGGSAIGYWAYNGLYIHHKTTNQPTINPLQALLGEARVAGWPEHRRAAIEDMVVFMRNSETPGLLTDLNEDVCYNCSCSGTVGMCVYVGGWVWVGW